MPFLFVKARYAQAVPVGKLKLEYPTAINRQALS